LAATPSPSSPVFACACSVTPSPPAWPRDFPLTIAALADIHVGEPHMSLDRVAAIVEATNALRADLIVLLGDYAGTDRVSRPPLTWFNVVPQLAVLKAPLVTFAILGNHEWWDDPVAQRLKRGPTLGPRGSGRVQHPAP